MNFQNRKKLLSFSFFAVMLGIAGLPVYIHAPKFYIDTYGISLSFLGVALFLLRLVDCLQDPFLARLAYKFRDKGAIPIAIASALLSVGIFCLFTEALLISPIFWFSFCLILTFSSFSFLTIRFYSQGIEKFGKDRQLEIARWRETGSLVGICLAAIAPFILIYITSKPFLIYAIVFVGINCFANWVMWREWELQTFSDHLNRPIWGLNHPKLRKLLFLAIFNTAPVAVTATLFLFFVESKLQAAEMSGLFLVIFFLAATIFAPFWTFLSTKYSTKKILLCSMFCAVITFSSVMFLEAGDVFLFFIICLASGATLGADLTLMPAIFAKHIVIAKASADLGFGLWNFSSKLALALAAVLTLPVLDFLGFQPGKENTENGIFILSIGYAIVPCILKLFAILLVLNIQLEE